jgi:predicted aconitase with swiveling domain
MRDGSKNFSAGTITATSFSGPLTGNVTGNVSGTAANVTGTVAVGNGGTGATTLTGLLLGNGSSAVTTITDSHTNWDAAYTAAVTNATASNNASTIVMRDSSKNFSAGTITATSFSGPLTGNVTGNVSGTAANVTGTVAVGNGGTGATSASAALTNLGAAPLASPTFTGTVTAPTLSVTGNATVTGTVTPTGGIVGKTDGSDASSGIDGEYVSSLFNGSAYNTASTWQNMTSITLTAGDWEVKGAVFGYNVTPAVVTVNEAISAYSGSTTTDQQYGENWMLQDFPVAVSNIAMPYMNWRVNVTSTTTIYFKVDATATIGSTAGRLSARRVR